MSNVKLERLRKIQAIVVLLHPEIVFPFFIRKREVEFRQS